MPTKRTNQSSSRRKAGRGSTTKSKPKSKKTPEYSKKIMNMKDTFQHLAFVCCAEDGRMRADKKTAELIEVMSKKTLHKASMKLVKKGLFNVRDGVFTVSKEGRKHIK